MNQSSRLMIARSGYSIAASALITCALVVIVLMAGGCSLGKSPLLSNQTGDASSGAALQGQDTSMSQPSAESFIQGSWYADGFVEGNADGDLRLVPASEIGLTGNIVVKQNVAAYTVNMNGHYLVGTVYLNETPDGNGHGVTTYSGVTPEGEIVAGFIA